MTEPRPPRPPGAHRRERGSRVIVLLASLVGVAIAAGVVTFALHERGEPAHGRSAASDPTPTTASAQPPVGLADRSTLRPSTTPSSQGPPTTPAPPPTTSRGASPSTATPALPALDVLNDSRITGLAHRAAKQFAAAGWSISTIGNFTGDHDVPATTIFYPDGDKAAADRLAAAFGVARVLQAPTGLSPEHLTVVLARDWPDSTK